MTNKFTDTMYEVMIDGKTLEGPLIQDTEHYIRTVTFLVGNKLFRVPRAVFDDPGTKFPITMPSPTDEDTPQVLDVDEIRFKALLRVMYPFIGGKQTLTDEDWLNVLDLATEWKIVDIRNMAITALNKWMMQACPKKVVLLSRKLHILSWLKAAYLKLVENALTTKDLSAPPSLDWETIARLFGAKYTTTKEGSRVNIEREFQGEFNSIREIWSEWPEPVSNRKLYIPQLTS